MKANALQALAHILVLVPSSPCLAQGPLTPPGAPLPTMKSLQEIWDKIAAQQAQITALQTRLSSVSDADAISAAGLALPWNLTTVGSVRDVGYSNSLAFRPDGQPAIYCRDQTNNDLKFAR